MKSKKNIYGLGLLLSSLFMTACGSSSAYQIGNNLYTTEYTHQVNSGAAYKSAQEKCESVGKTAEVVRERRSWPHIAVDFRCVNKDDTKTSAIYKTSSDISIKSESEINVNHK